jgi:hypothetical protein
MGVALGTLIPTTIVCLGFVLPYAIRVIGVTGSQMYKQVFIPAFVPIIPASAATYLLREFFEPVTILPTLLIAAVGSLLYLAGYLKAGTTEFERSLLRDTITRMVGHARHIRKRSKEGVY